MAYLKINGVTLTPSKCDVTYSDVDYNSGRTADGIMHRNRVRAGVIKASLSFNGVTPGSASTILAAASGEEFSAEVFSPRDNSMVKRTFYCGDQSTVTYSYNYDGKGSPLLESCSFDIIEV